MRDLIETVLPYLESISEESDTVGYRLEYQNSYTFGTDEWEIYKPLRRGQGFGAAFDTLKWFPIGTSHEIVKRYFWKTYKIDIDKLPKWKRLVKVEK